MMLAASTAYAVALEQLQSVSAAQVKLHAEATRWREELYFPFSFVWLPQEWSLQADNESLPSLFLSARVRRQMETCLRRQDRVWRQRAANLLSDQCSLRYAVQDIATQDRAASDTSCSPPALYLARTPLGQPVVRWRGSGAEWARQHGLLAHDLHISYTHDGDAHLTLLTQAPGLRGVGIDVVYLPRLFRASNSSEYAARFARHFMSAAEYTVYNAAAQNEPDTGRLRRAAAHFSLMEAASKALGTGLRIGGGMGHPTSLPKTELGVSRLTPTVEWILGDEARRRCAALGATTLEGCWSADDEYLVSVALLWNKTEKHSEAPMIGRE